jgi:hypothetical protein
MFEFLLFSLIVPKAEAAGKCIGIIARATVRRQRRQLFCVAPARHDILGFKRRNQLRHGFRDITLPFVYAQAVQTALPDVMLAGVPFPRQMAEFQGLQQCRL